MAMQLHATPKELVEFAAWCAKAHDLEIGAMEFPPERYFKVSASKVLSLADAESVMKLVLYRGGHAKADLERQAIEDALVFIISRPKDGKLRQSLVSVSGEDPETQKIWKQVSRELRKNTTAGVTAINRSTGATGHYKMFRFTEGAREMQKKGTIMLPLAGGSELNLTG